jgi:hypothetical protein
VIALNKASRMEMDDACGQIRVMVARAKVFRSAVGSVVSELTRTRCTDTPSDGTTIAEVCRPSLLWFLFRSSERGDCARLTAATTKPQTPEV